MNISRDYANKVAKNARRKPGNEAMLLFWAISIVVGFWVLLGAPVELITAISMRMNAIAGAFAFGGIISAACSLPYFFWVRRKVAAKKIENNEIMKIERAKREKEKQEKILLMHENAGS